MVELYDKIQIAIWSLSSGIYLLREYAETKDFVVALLFLSTLLVCLTNVVYAIQIYRKETKVKRV